MASSLRASEAIQGRKQRWIASSQGLLAMTERISRTNPQRHCERSEAIQGRKQGRIAWSLTLLAMTETKAENTDETAKEK
jgi:hypothetical protein